MAIGKPLGNMVIELGLDSAAFTKNLKGASQAVRSATSEMKANFSIIDKGGSKLDTMKSKQSGLTKVIEAQEKEVKLLTEAYKNSHTETGEATSKTADLARKANDAQAKLAAYKYELEQTSLNLREMDSETIAVGKSMTDFGTKMKNIGEKVGSVGKSLTTSITLPIMGIATAATVVGKNFKQKMAEVQAISGATGAELEQMGDLAKEWGAKTKFSASESADAMKYMSMAGWSTQETMKGLPAVLNLAIASGEELGTTSDIVTDALSAFGLKAEDAIEFTDILAATANGSNTSVSMLGESFKYVAPLAGSLGHSAKDTSFALGLMANNGVKASQGGTSLKTALVNLTEPTKAMQGVMTDLGISMLDANGEVKQGKELYDHLRDKIGKLPKAQQAAASATLFGKEALAGMLSVVNASDDDYNKLYKNLNNSAGATDKMAEIMQNTADGAITSMKSALEGAGIAIFESLEPYIVSVAKKIGELAGWFTKLDLKVMSTIVIFGGLLAAVGPVLLVIAKLVTVVGTISTAVGTVTGAIGLMSAGLGGVGASAVVATPAMTALAGVFTFITGPIGLTIAAIIAVGIALVALYKKSDTFKEGVKAIFEQVKTIFSTGMSFIKTVMEQGWNVLRQIFQVFKALFSGDTEAFWIQLKKLGEIGMIAIKLVFEKGWTLLKQIVLLSWEAIKTIFNTSQKITEGLNSVFWSAIRVLFETAKKLLSNVVSNMWSDFKNLFTVGGNLIKTVSSAVWTGVRNIVSDKVGEMLQKVTDLPGLMANGIKKGAGALKKAFVDMWNNVVAAVRKPVNMLIGGANWVLEKVGATKLDEWPVQKYAKGTPWGGHPGGLAMVNDQKGSNYEELIETKDGNRFIPKGRDVVLDLPKGSKVFPALQTKNLLKYAKGTKGAKKEADDGIDIMSLFSAPGKLAQKAIDKFVNFKDMAKYPLAVGKGIVNKAKDSLGNFLASQFHTGEGGEYGGFGGFPGLKMTSPYGWRTHPISGQRKFHSGIDFGGGQRFGHPIHAQANGVVDFSGAMGGYGNVVRTKAGAFQHMYAHLQKRLASVGQNVNKGQLIGEMGSTGNSTGPHVHYEVRQNGKAVDPMKSIQGAVGGTGGVERWRSTVMQALAMNKLPVNEAYISAWLRQIKTESGGDPLAVQGNIGDINNRTGDLAKGLVQVIGATFNRYKFPGHNNRLNGLDSLLAGMNYAKNRYGVTGMLNKIGMGRGYANGGLVTSHQLAEIGEGNKPEMVIPLTKKARALQLIQKSLDILGVDAGQPKSSMKLTPSSNNGGITINIREMIVREEADIKKISDEIVTMIHRKQARELKAGGMV